MLSFVEQRKRALLLVLGGASLALLGLALAAVVVAGWSVVVVGAGLAAWGLLLVFGLGTLRSSYWVNATILGCTVVSSTYVMGGEDEADWMILTMAGPAFDGGDVQTMSIDVRLAPLAFRVGGASVGQPVVVALSNRLSPRLLSGRRIHPCANFRYV